ncbi:MAG: YEATS-associated helix-containing protein [Haliscomenobacter sp.]|uniref:YEATS-associated helix-containing protein n=1 Tax=Haliscomenobacter sp. TaxID=2717303 RepID=UPI0029BB3255|nr:YEATS-associated helix-containing protein [Haliscomenobacter sp.]MDX2072562.1 YEATS-associated helix-containing protein [Haliscomenobacter sp.]
MPDTTINVIKVQPEVAEVTQNITSDKDFYIFLTIIILMGLLGGLANYLNSKKEERHFWRSAIMGIVAAFTIPLFLNVVDSNLIAEEVNLRGYLVFSGFCVLAAFYAGKFLEGLSTQVLQNLQKKVEETSNKADEAAIKANLLAEAQLVENQDKESDTGSKGVNYDELTSESDSSPQAKIEAAFKASSRNVQTLESLMKKTELSAEEVQKELDAMVKSGKVGEAPHKNGKIYVMLS